MNGILILRTASVATIVVAILLAGIAWFSTLAPQAALQMIAVGLALLVLGLTGLDAARNRVISHGRGRMPRLDSRQAIPHEEI